MAAVASPVMREETMDTRRGTPSPVQRTGSNEASGKPDLSDEVAMLSTKLVNAINYQTNLDDSLQATRHELEQTRNDLERIRNEKKELDDLVARGVLVRRSSMERQLMALRQELAREREQREIAEKAKKQGEYEMEEMSAQLFEEANKMVVIAKKEAEMVERRNSQLRSQLNDTELLLVSQTEQLQDLKGVMEKLGERASEHESATRDSSVPSTPIHSITSVWDAVQFSPSAADPGASIPPNHPLYFSQLLTPVMRNDLQAYHDFQDLLSIGRRLSPHSRQGSGSAVSTSSVSQSNLAASSSPSLPGAFSFGGYSSASNSPSSATFSGASASAPPLKESKFYKRTLLEDIEPTLRLDLAPGLSFLSRRSVLSSLLAGTLVVEPFMPQQKFYGPAFACALCGESRKNEPYIRKHRFRTSEEESAQRYPLCDYCLGRIRAAGDFVGFLRMVRDGHWKADSDEDKHTAWEEAVRLRERMFWARLGGGVVPTLKGGSSEVLADGIGSPGSHRAVKSARGSLESIPERRRMESAVSAIAGGDASETNSVVDPEESREVESDVPVIVEPQAPANRSMDGIAVAATGDSSAALSIAEPDVSQQRSADEVAASDEPTSQAVQDEEKPEEDSEIVTPTFEEAPTDSQQEQVEASEQLQREAEQAEDQQQPSETPATPKPASDLTPLPPVPAIAEPQAESESDNSSSRPVSPVNKSFDLGPTPAGLPHGRRPSSVLERIEAMEAKNATASEQLSGPGKRDSSPPKLGGKIPGGFD